MNRTKGFSFDTSGHANAASLLVRGAEARARGVLGLGEGIGSGLLGLGRGIQAKRAEDRQAARDAKSDQREDRRLALAEGNADWDKRSDEWRMGLERARFQQGQYEFEDRSLRDAENALLDYESRGQETSSRLQTIQGAAVANPDLMNDPMWQREFESARMEAERHGERVALLRQRIERKTGAAPQARTPSAIERPGAPAQAAQPARTKAPTTGEVAQRAQSAEEMIERGRVRVREGQKAGSFAVQIEGARMVAAGNKLLKEQEREARRQIAEGEATKDRAQWGANFDAFLPIAQQEQYAGVGRDVKAALAQQVMSGGLTIPQATAELQRAAWFTSEAGAMRGEARGAGKVAEAGSTGTRTPEQEQARQDAERVARGEERQTAKSERDVKAALRAFTNEADNRDFYGDPVPPRLELLSSEDARTVLSSPEASPGVRDLARRVLESRGELVGAVPAPGPAVERPAAGVGGPREAAARELKALPAEQQTPEAWAAIKRKHGL